MLFNDEGNIILSQLNELLKTYYMATGISIIAINKEGNTLLTYGDSLAFCRQLNCVAAQKCDCKKFHLQACQYTINIGEPYFCFCPQQLFHIAVPLAYQEQFWGGLLVGPLIVHTPHQPYDPQQAFTEHCQRLGVEPTPALAALFQQLPVVDPIRANYLGNTLFMMAAQQMESYQQFMDKIKSKMEQQNKIHEQLQLYKNIANKNANFHELEMQLFTKVKSGNLQEAKDIIGRWQAMILFGESDMEVLKVRAIELCSLLSRAAIEGGADPKQALASNYSFVEPLNNLDKIEDLSYWLNTILEYYTESVLQLPNLQNADVMRQAVQYMTANFAEPITVKDVADHVHMNHTYFSSLFKKMAQKSFADYLQQIRIEESKLLLATTNQTILSIAVACGFSSQSYFSKVFLKATGLTPKQYRQMNAVTPMFNEEV